MKSSGAEVELYRSQFDSTDRSFNGLETTLKISDCPKSVSENGEWWHVFTLDGKTNKLKWACNSGEAAPPVWPPPPTTTTSTTTKKKTTTERRKESAKAEPDRRESTKAEPDRRENTKAESDRAAMVQVPDEGKSLASQTLIRHGWEGYGLGCRHLAERLIWSDHH